MPDARRMKHTTGPNPDDRMGHSHGALHKMDAAQSSLTFVIDRHLNQTLKT